MRVEQTTTVELADPTLIKHDQLIVNADDLSDLSSGFFFFHSIIIQKTFFLLSFCISLIVTQKSFSPFKFFYFSLTNLK